MTETTKRNLTTIALTSLQDKLGYHFKDSSLLQAALTHKSAQNAPHGHYERLEFLGDRVLGLEISHALYQHFQAEDQGYLTKRFHALVQQSSLADIAKKLDLQDLIITDAAGQAAQQPSVLSDVIEALIAALYLDGGRHVASDFIFQHLDITATTSNDSEMNPKSALQEWAMARKLPLPAYHLLEVTGPDHAPLFTIEVTLGDNTKMQATGASKKEAERHAARLLLQMVQQKESS